MVTTSINNKVCDMMVDSFLLSRPTTFMFCHVHARHYKPYASNWATLIKTWSFDVLCTYGAHLKKKHADTDNFTVYSLDQPNFLASIAPCARVVLACSVAALKGADEWQQ